MDVRAPARSKARRILSAVNLAADVAEEREWRRGDALQGARRDRGGGLLEGGHGRDLFAGLMPHVADVLEDDIRIRSACRSSAAVDERRTEEERRLLAHSDLPVI